jgi:GxxExxY protein
LTAETGEIAEIIGKRIRQPMGRSLQIAGGVNAEAARLNALTDQIIGAAIAVHKTLGPGLLESACESCLYYELVKRGMKVGRQKPLPLIYGDVKLECSYRMDLVVEESVVIEVKSVARLDRVHDAQMISYLKISGLHVGLILNFNVKNLTDSGIRRKVNEFPDRV